MSLRHNVFVFHMVCEILLGLWKPKSQEMNCSLPAISKASLSQKCHLNAELTVAWAIRELLTFFLVAKSLLLAPGYPVPERHSFRGFPFGNAPSLPESPDTLLPCWASPTHGAGGGVVVLLAFLPRLQKRTQRPQMYKYLCFSVTQQAELSGLCQISGEKGFVPRNAAYWYRTPAGLELSVPSGMASTSQKQSPKMEWGVAGEKKIPALMCYTFL